MNIFRNWLPFLLLLEGSRAGSFSHDLKKEWILEKKEGDKVPDVNFLTRIRTLDDSFDWKTMTTIMSVSVLLEIIGRGTMGASRTP